jgi:hypothetical protein
MLLWAMLTFFSSNAPQSTLQETKSTAMANSPSSKLMAARTLSTVKISVSLLSCSSAPRPYTTMSSHSFSTS